MSESFKPQVALLMGSDKDYEVMREAKRVLDEFGVACEMRVISAHRTPRLCAEFAASARERGIKVIIAGAGRAAHLAGVVAAWTTLPVIGVPLDAGMQGVDALLSTVQMPAGVPVATMAVGRSGAVNAALFAVEILALEDRALRERLERFRERQAEETRLKDERLRGGREGAAEPD